MLQILYHWEKLTKSLTFQCLHGRKHRHIILSLISYFSLILWKVHQNLKFWSLPIDAKSVVILTCLHCRGSTFRFCHLFCCCSVTSLFLVCTGIAGWCRVVSTQDGCSLSSHWRTGWRESQMDWTEQGVQSPDWKVNSMTYDLFCFDI